MNVKLLTILNVSLFIFTYSPTPWSEIRIPSFQKDRAFDFLTGEQGWGFQTTTGDFNGDSIQDIAIYLTPDSSFHGPLPAAFGQARLLAQDRKGIFSVKEISLSAQNATNLLSADFDKDGRSELIISNSGPDKYDANDRPIVELNTGGVSYVWSNGITWAANEANPQFLHDTAIGDINKDGYLDALALSLHKNSYFLINNGAGNFSVSYPRVPATLLDPWLLNENYSLTVDGSPNWRAFYSFSSATLVDANRDGYLDILALPFAMAPNAVLYLNEGSGDFSKAVPQKIRIETGYGPGLYSDAGETYGAAFLSAATLDLNNDGYSDIITIATKIKTSPSYEYYQGTRVKILINNGSTFNDETSNRLLDFNGERTNNFDFFSRAIKYDFNNDGLFDVFLTNDSETRFLINQGNGILRDMTDSFGIPKGHYVPYVGNDKSLRMLRLERKMLSYNSQTQTGAYKILATIYKSETGTGTNQPDYKEPHATLFTKVTKGNGYLDSIPKGISCGSVCSYKFTKNMTVKLIATPASGARFGGWSGGCTGKKLTCSVKLKASKTVKAKFN